MLRLYDKCTKTPHMAAGVQAVTNGEKDKADQAQWMQRMSIPVRSKDFCICLLRFIVISNILFYTFQ
jgi:hypothetical protein